MLLLLLYWTVVLLVVVFVVDTFNIYISTNERKNPFFYHF